MIMYVSNQRKAVLKELSRLTGETWRVGKRREYPVLLRDNLVITEGEIEVKERIDQLQREHAIYLES